MAGNMKHPEASIPRPWNPLNFLNLSTRRYHRRSSKQCQLYKALAFYRFHHPRQHWKRRALEVVVWDNVWIKLAAIAFAVQLSNAHAEKNVYIQGQGKAPWKHCCLFWTGSGPIAWKCLKSRWLMDPIFNPCRWHATLDLKTNERQWITGANLRCVERSISKKICRCSCAYFTENACHMLLRY